MQFSRLVSILPGLLSALTASLAVANLATGSEPTFSRDVQPILSDHCYQCHGPDEEARQADLRLDLQASLLAAVGESRDPDDSELFRRIASDDLDEIMPPPSSKHKLTDLQVQAIHDWIAAGAKWQGHWSFLPPERPSLPRLSNESWLSHASNEVDYFILNKLSDADLVPNQMAAPHELLRRVTLDLTGTPPTLEQMDAFEQEPTDAAYERLVTQLLASPRFGERMAMEWLDAARYADTNGYQGDNERTMWPWRDWVISAFNQNMPYDEFSIWQLAGDLLPNTTDEQKLATGFCRNHMINGEGGRIAEENRVEYIFDQIETVGTVWMGLTVQCCRCHDHKFDPVAQSEYFQLFAFFNQTPVNGGGGDPQMAPNITIVPELQRDTLAQQEKAVNVALGSLEKAELNCETPLEAVAKALEEKPVKRNDEQWKLLLDHFNERDKSVSKQIEAYRNSKGKLDQIRRRLPKVMVMQDQATDKQRETFILTKGLYNQPTEKVQAGTPAFLPKMNAKDKNRLALARWLVSGDHPLTARVTVNRVWQTFFGTGLVKTTEDFGVQGEKPSHPELLDWLAVEFVESGWDLKHLVRLIVTSSTYRQSSQISPRQLEIDPENRLLSRGPRGRMPAWMIRDQALCVADITVDPLGGPSVKPYQPSGIWSEASFGKKKYSQDHGEKLYRRSLYTYWRRIIGPTMFFDMPRRQTCSVRNGKTNTPLHALVTLNDTTYVEAARLMAQRIMDLNDDTTERLSTAFRLATGRRATSDEISLIAVRLQTLDSHYSANVQAATDLLGVGEFGIRLDTDRVELASYTTVCLMLLNLDEALSK